MGEEIMAKRLKLSPPPIIGTHNGHFHADEALAVYLLRMLPDYNPSTLLRTRDAALLSTCHTVVDVGGVYDPKTHRYDHHQRSFSQTFPNRLTKLSSAGLVYLHFGKAIIAQHTSLLQDSDEVSVLFEKLYTEFVEALDAHDNGISAYDPTALQEAGIKKRFSDGGVTLGSLVGDLNPKWNDPEESMTAQDARFLEASQLMGSTFVRKLSYYSSSWLPARSLVHAAYAQRFKYDAGGRVLVLEESSAPWKDHLYTLEGTKTDAADQVLFVLYPESRAPDAKWRIQAVPVSKDSFESRKALPEAWRGLRDKELDEVIGIPGCVFVHAAGFIGGNKTLDGVRAMAQKAIE